MAPLAGPTRSGEVNAFEVFRVGCADPEHQDDARHGGEHGLTTTVEKGGQNRGQGIQAEKQVLGGHRVIERPANAEEECDNQHFDHILLQRSLGFALPQTVQEHLESQMVRIGFVTLACRSFLRCGFGANGVQGFFHIIPGGKEQGTGAKLLQLIDDCGAGRQGDVATEHHRQVLEQNWDFSRRDAFGPLAEISNELGLVGASGDRLEDDGAFAGIHGVLAFER